MSGQPFVLQRKVCRPTKGEISNVAHNLSLTIAGHLSCAAAEHENLPHGCCKRALPNSALLLPEWSRPIGAARAPWR